MVADNQASLLDDASLHPLAQPLEKEHLNHGMQEPRLHEFDISGLYYFPEFRGSAAQREVMDCIDRGGWCENLKLKRRVQHYGWRYDYDARTTAEKAEPLPVPFTKVAERLAAIELPDGKKLFNKVPDQVIVNEYLPGQGIALHTDRTDCFGPTVATISLGDDWEMKLQPINGTSSQARRIMLVRGSALIMTGDARFDWKHGIQPRKYEKMEHGGRRKRRRRLSLTFRIMLDQSSQ